MLQATASLMAEARAEEQGRLLSSYSGDRTEPVGGTLKRDYNRRSGYSLTARLRTRVCSDSCLKVVYLSCATLISASFIVECILLHLIIVPYLSESVFEAGACRYIGSRSEMKKRCENKCSKERSYFPCLQVSVRFTPFRQVLSTAYGSNNSNSSHMDGDTDAADTWKRFLVDGLHSAHYDSFWERTRKRHIPKEMVHNLNATESRMVYLYDYFSTFAAHKVGRCATSPCHRREEDNVVAVEEFKRELWSRKEFLCYARPSKHKVTASMQSDPLDTLPPLEPTLPLSETDAASDSSTITQMDSDEEVEEENENELGELPDESIKEMALPHQPNQSRTETGETVKRQRPFSVLFSPRSRDAQDAAAILHRLYSSTMFWHSLCWPCGIFLGSLLLLLFTYLADGCEAWASDKTVIA